MNIHEATGAQLAPAVRRNLPNRILRAFDNAMHLEGLGRGVKDALAELCRFVPQNRPFDTIFAHKTTIAARIGMSERTLYRHLATLQEKLLITVQDQDRKSRNGRFGVARICLTRKAAALLGLIEAPEELALIEVGDRKTESNKIDRREEGATVPGFDSTLATCTPSRCNVASSVVHSLPSAKLTAGHTLSEPTISRNHPLTSSENGLPVDLNWLTGNGISRAGIFKLMGLAKIRGKRLSDIVAVTYSVVQMLKGGQLYCYLAKLIAGPTDFVLGAAAERQRIEDARQARVVAQKEAVFKKRFRNVALTNPQQNRLYLIDERAAFVQILGGKYPTSAPLNDLRDWISQLETGRLVLATLATEQRLRS